MLIVQRAEMKYMNIHLEIINLSCIMQFIDFRGCQYFCKNYIQYQKGYSFTGKDNLLAEATLNFKKY